MQTVTVRGQEVCFGRLTTPKSVASLPLRLYLDQAALPQPVYRDWTGKISRWPMAGNDRVGDCVLACRQHFLQVASTYGEGREIVVPDQDVVSEYFKETGGPDSGLNIGQSLAHWQKHPFGGKTILAAAAINFHDHVETILASQLFGGVTIGVNLAQEDIDAFDRGQPWISARGRPDPEKGHCIYLAATAGDGPTFITWGAKQKASWDWFTSRVEEGYVVLYAGWFQGQSLDPSGLDDVSLMADYQAITGQAPPVVPTPVPDPSPSPSPTPVPVPTTLNFGARFTLDGKTWFKPTGFEKVSV